MPEKLAAAAAAKREASPSEDKENRHFVVKKRTTLLRKIGGGRRRCSGSGPALKPSNKPSIPESPEQPAKPSAGGRFFGLVTPLSLGRKRNRPKDKDLDADGPGRQGEVQKAHSKSLMTPRKNLYKLFRNSLVSSAKKGVADNARSSSGGVIQEEPMKKSVPPPKPARPSLAKNRPLTEKNKKSAPKKPDTLVLNIEGVRYRMSEDGTKLHQIPDLNAKEEPLKRNPRKLFLEGEEFVEAEPGVLAWSRHSMTRQSINSARNRSIQTIRKSEARSKQHCMFFNKFGRCGKKESGICPYLHDQSKVATCKRFLRGECRKFGQCLLSHKVPADKLPKCKLFLTDGKCPDPAICPYRHDQDQAAPEPMKSPEKVNATKSSQKDSCHRQESANEPVTKKDLKQAKENSGDDKKRDNHEEETVKTQKKAPPLKPKRKCLKAPALPPRHVKGDELEQSLQQKRKHEGSFSVELKAKRKRLLSKIELAKQGWIGVGGGSGSHKKDDSIGELPSFIALEKSEVHKSSSCISIAEETEASEDYQERLI